MKRFFLSITVLLVLTGCSSASQENNSIAKEKQVIVDLLKPLERKGIKIKQVKKVENPKLESFDTFIVDLEDNNLHREIRRYIFINPKNKELILQVFKYNHKNGSLELTPVKPKHAEKQLKIDISFLEKVEKELTKANIPHVVGKGEKKVYIVWDVFCPFCYRHFSKIEEIARKNNIEIHMIPLAVHREDSLKGLVYYTKLAREKGTAEALKELYNMGNGNFMKYAKALEKKLQNEKKITEDQENLIKTLKNVEVQLVKNGVRATPTLIYAPPGKDKAYIHVGFIPVEELLKKK